MPSVFNFTHVYEAYAFMQDEAFNWVDCTQVEGTDCYCDTEAEKQLKGLMANQPLEAVHKPSLSRMWQQSSVTPYIAAGADLYVLPQQLFSKVQYMIVRITT